jgi:hypothetical protein
MADRVERALRRRPIRYFARELTLDGEIFKPLKIRNCFVEQLDGVDGRHMSAR